MKIRVCIPYYAEYESCKKGLAELVACKEHEFVIEARQGTYIGKIRNSLINDQKSSRAVQEPLPGFDAFLTIDSDISFCLSDVLRLIGHDRPIVGAPYLKHEKNIYECGSFNEKGSILNFDPDTKIKSFSTVEWMGAGFMLIKAEVFEKTEYPWYRHIMLTHEHKGSKYKEEYWEDIGFCINAKNSGFDIWCDFDIKIKHMPRIPGVFQNQSSATEGRPEATIKRYYQNYLNAIKQKEQLEVKMVTVGDVMGWTAEETNNILGANVMTPPSKGK